MPDANPGLMTVFAEALAISDPAERAAHLDHAFGGDANLRRRVEELLAAHLGIGRFFEPDRTGAYELAPPDATSTFDSARGTVDLPSETSPAGTLGPDTHRRKSMGTGDYRPDGATGTDGRPTRREPVFAAELGSVVAGRYTLVEVIGEGGMGSVYLATQSEPVKREVALKLIRAGMDSKAVLARFDAERQALALMDHPNIARIYDGGVTEQGQPFFVMELVKGVPLTEYCDAKRLTVDARLQLFVAVCNAVQHAHQKGIIHRDLKPGNVLVTEVDGRPTPKVIDFGVAKATEVKLTDMSFADAGAIVGTPAYMSPEQADPSSMDIDTRTDVYALGVVLYELLTGSPPIDSKQFKRGAILEVLRMVREVEPPRPSTKLSTAIALPNIATARNIEPTKLAKLLRGELDWVVMKALEKDRSRRYESANGFASDVQRYLAGEPVLAYPPSKAYRLRKFVRRNRGPVLAATVVLLALLVGIIGTTFGMIQAEERRREAEVARDAEAAAMRDADEKRRLAEQAAAAEKAAREQTQKRLAQIEKGVELFAGMLTGINPRAETLGGEPIYVQLRQRAERTADALDAEAVGDPLAVARLQSILGNTLRELGSNAKAIEVLGKARRIRERELGVDHPDTLTTLHDLALVYLAVGKVPEAITLFERVRDGFVKSLGGDHDETLNALNSLANAYRLVGQLPEAIALFGQVRDARVRKLGADHPATLTTLNGLAGTYQAVGQLPEAIALFGQVRDARVRKLGADHPATLTTLNNLAEAYRLAGQLPEAIALFGQVRDGLVKKMGAEHPSTLTVLSNLAGTYLAAGMLPEAIALYEQAANSVAKLQFQHEHADKIIPSTIAAYERAAQFDKAEGWRRQWLAVVRKQSGADSPAYADQLAALALNLLQQEKWADAEPILRECLPIREKKLPDAWNTFNTKSQLGGALMGQKKYAEAEPLLLKGYEGMKAREKAIPQQASARLTESIDRLIELYTATNRPDELKKWRAERAKYPPPVDPLAREKK